MAKGNTCSIKKLARTKMDNKSLKKLEADLWESADLLRADSAR